MNSHFQLDVSQISSKEFGSVQKFSIVTRSKLCTGTPKKREKETEVKETKEPAPRQEPPPQPPETKIYDRAFDEQIDKELVPVVNLIKGGYYKKAKNKLYMLMDSYDDNVVWDKLLEKLGNVVAITAEISGDDKISINKIYYAWELSEDQTAKQLYIMPKDQYVEIAKSQEMPKGFKLVDYKLFLALYYIYDGKFNLAMEESSDILDLEPGNITALKRLGSAMYCVANAEKNSELKAKAKEVWAKALKLSPKDQEIREFLSNHK
ncbi:MAG: hypothetical protein ABIA17_02030 [Elusimicrobiota bacterium]